jgi:hypothetical protein
LIVGRCRKTGRYSGHLIEIEGYGGEWGFEPPGTGFSQNSGLANLPTLLIRSENSVPDLEIASFKASGSDPSSWIREEAIR